MRCEGGVMERNASNNEARYLRIPHGFRICARSNRHFLRNGTEFSGDGVSFGRFLKLFSFFAACCNCHRFLCFESELNVVLHLIRRLRRSAKKQSYIAAQSIERTAARKNISSLWRRRRLQHLQVSHGGDTAATTERQTVCYCISVAKNR